MFKLRSGLRVLQATVMLASATALAQSADLSVAFDGGSSLTLGGKAGKFGVIVSNAGPDVATDVQVTATPPDGAEVADVGPGCDVPDGGASYTCSIAAIPSGGKVQFVLSVDWPAPDPVPTTCPTNLALAVSVAATQTDPTPANNTASKADVTSPLADVVGTALSPAPPSTDGGTPAKLVLPGDTVTLTGKLTNNGPCAVPAGAMDIDSSADDTGSWGLTFVSGAGGCTDWSLNVMDTPDGICVVPTELKSGQSLDFTVTAKVSSLSDAGGDSIIQTAANWNYNIDYQGNIGSSASPSTFVMVQGPGSTCSVAGAGVAMPLLLALWLMRRRQAR